MKIKRIDLKEYGPVINNEQVGASIYDTITSALKDHDIVELDVAGIRFITTFCANQIFGNLFTLLGSDYYTRIIRINASDSFASSVDFAIDRLRDKK